MTSSRKESRQRRAEAAGYATYGAYEYAQRNAKYKAAGKTYSQVRREREKTKAHELGYSTPKDLSKARKANAAAIKYLSDNPDWWLAANIAHLPKDVPIEAGQFYQSIVLPYYDENMSISHKRMLAVRFYRTYVIKDSEQAILLMRQIYGDSR